MCVQVDVCLVSYTYVIDVRPRYDEFCKSTCMYVYVAMIDSEAP